MNYIEQNCTFTGPNGRQFTSGGAYVSPKYIIAYLGKNGVLTTWHGKPLGTYCITRSWKIHSYVSDTMNQVYATVDGIRYTGRSGGVGMLFRGRPVKDKRN